MNQNHDVTTNIHLFERLKYVALTIARASLVVQIVKSLPTMVETWVQSLGQEDPLEKDMANNPLFLPGKSHG